MLRPYFSKKQSITKYYNFMEIDAFGYSRSFSAENFPLLFHL
ncbi:hypothetical protein KsCSTR_38530 [Candidatus Kuenenia stuttgartiensis]|uniref:Uncharacterized protein n=1 Tax=Kuenenia stuttgartiensis TaxID=174633 RepID=A0A6G7GV51_KUEST|nr:hypothetical protein KsCSTR_38530 [Candidatus Kuenenia stuttgartiensis]